MTHVAPVAPGADPPADPGSDPGLTRDAIVLFADLSGFSALSARLVAHDDRAAEDIRDLLNAQLCVVIDTVVAWGGCVVASAGDSVLAHWPDASTGAATAARGCAAALHAGVGVAADRLPLRLVLDAGRFALCDVAGRRLPVGPVVDRLALTAPRAGAAQTWVAPGVPVGASTPVPPAALAQAPAERLDWQAELRRTTVLFARMPGLETVQTDSLTRRLDAAHTAVEEGGGQLVHIGADDKGVTLMGVWGLSGAVHEDDDERAVTTAIVLSRQLAGAGCRARVALTAGTSFAGVLGNDRFATRTVLGAHVNLAARAATLTQAAAEIAGADMPEAVWVAPEVAERAAGRFTFDPGPVVAAKGSDGRVAFLVPSGQAEARAGNAARLIGRTAEVERLRALIARVAVGADAPGTVAVTAEAGIGKSHLVHTAFADMTGVRRLRIVGDRMRRQTAYAPWRPALSELTGWTGETGPGPIRAALEGDPLACVLNPLLPFPMPETAEASALNVIGRAEALRRRALALVSRGIAEVPTLLVVEDAHWLDSASWQLLADLRRAIPGVGLVLVSRPLDADAAPPEARALLSGAERIDLGPLTPGDAAALVADALETDSVPRVLADWIHARTGGHALFTKELARALAERGVVICAHGHCHLAAGVRDLSDVAFPEGIGGAIAERIGRLDAGAQLTLKVASVQGRVFSEALLHATHPQAPAPSALTAQLQAIAGLGLIERQDAPGRWRFHHALTRESAYDLLLRRQVRTLHAALAEVLEAAPGVPDPAVLATHWDRADAPDRAMPWIERAAAAAEATQSNREVLAFARRALARAPDLSAPPTQARLAHWHKLAGVAARELGSLTEAETHMRRMIALEDAAPPEGKAALVRGILSEVLTYGRRNARRVSRTRTVAAKTDAAATDTDTTDAANTGRGRDACSASDHAIGRDTDHDSARDSDRARALRAARGHLLINEIHYHRQDTPRMLYHAFAAWNRATAAGGESPELGWASGNMAMIGFNVPWAVNSTPHLARCIAIAGRGGDPAIVSWLYIIAGNYAFGRGDWTEACRWLERAMEVAQAGHELRNWETAAASLANVLRLRGHVRDSDALGVRVFASGQDRGVSQVKLWGLTGRLKSLLTLGDLEAFDAIVTRHASLMSDELNRKNASANNIVGLELTQGLRALFDGRDEAARQHLETTIRVYGAVRQPQTFAIDPIAYLADGIAALWRRNPGDAELRAFARFNARKARGVARLYPPARPRAALVAGDLAAMEGRPRHAARHWQTARALARAARIPHDVAMASDRLATAGDADAAAARDAALAEISLTAPALWRL